jgi:hypothetical protein
MTYVEWLRVRGVLKVTTIVLFVLFLCTIGLRVYIFSKGDILSYISTTEKDPHSRVTESVLPDGTKRTTIDDKTGRTHITIDDRGYAGKHIEIIDRSSRHHEGDQNLSIGSMHVQALPAGAGERIVIDTNEPEPFVFYSAIAAFVALIIATVLGAPFARENDGHLEIALTKPISRTMLALRTVGADLAGIFGSWLLTVLFLIVGSTLFQAPHIVFGASDLIGTACGLLGAFAWYALLCAATASMKRSYGIVLGLSWPFAIVVLVLGKANLGSHPIAVALHSVASWIGFIMPFTYLHFGPAMTVNGRPAGSLAFAGNVEAPALAALAIGYVALAVFQWRRVQG